MRTKTIGVLSEDIFNYRPNPPDAHFNGAEYKTSFDHTRLRGQMLAIFELMSDQSWRTLGEIERETGYPQPSISAQLRHLKKERFGSHTVNRRARGNRNDGLFEYQLILASCPRAPGEDQRENKLGGK